MEKTRRISSGGKGSEIVEFALVMPIFFLLLFAIIDFGWYFYNQHTIQFATREGTRLALVGRQLTAANGTVMTREDSIIKTIKDNAGLAVDPDKLQISIYPVGANYTDPADWSTTVDAGNGGDYMRVRVLYTYNFLTPFIGNLFTGGNIVISAEALYRNELF